MNEELTLQQAMDILAARDIDLTLTGAVDTVGKLKHTPAVPHLVALLAQVDPGTSYLIVQALGRIADAAAVPALLDALRGDDPWVRAAAAGSLIQIGAPAVDGLVAGLRDPEKTVRRASAKALGKIGDSQEIAVMGLSGALLDIDSGVRRFAAEALGRLGDEAAVPSLAEALTDRDADTRIAAFRALASLATPEAQAAVRNWAKQQ